MGDVIVNYAVSFHGNTCLFVQSHDKACRRISISNWRMCHPTARVGSYTCFNQIFLLLIDTKGVFVYDVVKEDHWWDIWGSNLMGILRLVQPTFLHLQEWWELCIVRARPYFMTEFQPHRCVKQFSRKQWAIKAITTLGIIVELDISLDA